MSTQRSLKQSKETYLNQYESEMKYLHNNPVNQEENESNEEQKN